MNRAEMLRRLKAGEDALELSILKWQDIVDGKGEDEMADNCALCQKYGRIGDWCAGCLIKEKTGLDDCLETPYVYYHNACFDKTKLEFARQELEFLKGLRKAGSAKKKEPKKK